MTQTKYCHLCGYEDTADTCFRCGGKMHTVPYERTSYSTPPDWTPEEEEAFNELSSKAEFYEVLDDGTTVPMPNGDAK